MNGTGGEKVLSGRLSRAIVTGGNGYLGSELIRQMIDRGIEVYAIAHVHTQRLSQMLPSQAIRKIGDDYAAIDRLVQEVQPNAIFHLAAIHAEPPTFPEMMEMLNCGIRLGVALLHGAAECATPPVFLHAGTYWQFEKDRYSPNTFYAAAKQGLHDMLEYYRRVRSIPSATLVLYDIFGPDDTRPKLWRRLMTAAPGSTIPLSEGRQFMEVVHVADIARAFLHASAMLMRGEPVDTFVAVRSGVRITLRELVEQVQQRANLDLSFDWGAIPYWPGQIFEPWQGPLLAHWKPLIEPVDGLAELILKERAVHAHER